MTKTYTLEQYKLGISKEKLQILNLKNKDRPKQIRWLSEWQ